jgi:hypothetical protein
MSTRTITGTVLDSAGNAATGTVRFVLERGTWSAAEHAIPDETTATLTAGAFSITVYTPARYKVYLPTGYHFSVNIPAGSATTIEALRLASEDLPDLSTVLDDFLEALEINGLDYAAGQTPRWDGDSWEPAEYYTEAETDALLAALALDDLADVNAATPNNGDVLTWDSTPGEWVASPASSGVTDVGDLTATGYGAGQSPRWDGAAFAAADYYTEAEVTALISDFITQAAADLRYGRLATANTWALAQTFTGQVLAAAGTSGAPGVSFSADPNTGMYRLGEDDLGLSAGGLRFRLTTAAVTMTIPTTVTVTDAVTNTASSIYNANHNTSGTPAANYGSTFDWRLQSSTTSNQSAATERVYWSDATHASRTSRYAIQTTYNAGSLADTLAAGRTGAADSTGLWLYDETAASLKQVTRGAADSGGAGFRLLRVAN